MALHEIVLPETKPETEWVRGRPLQKMSPTYRHAVVQRRLATALGTWAEETERGRVGTEWRFRVTPPGEITRPLVPDVSYLSFEAFSADEADEMVDVPLAAPTVAFEILSSGDRAVDVNHKIDVYLAAGASAVVVIDPKRASAVVHDRDGARIVAPNAVLTHPELPGFALPIARLFARP